LGTVLVVIIGLVDSGSAVTLSPPVLQSGTISFQFDTTADQVFTVQSANALSSEWTDVAVHLGTGAPIDFSGPITGTGRFFRVKVSPRPPLGLSPSAPVLATGPVSLPDAVVGVPYAEEISPALSGVPPYTLQITGTRPDGITLVLNNNNATNAVVQIVSTGTGLVAEQRTQFTVTVVDGVNTTASRDYDLRVVAAPPQISISQFTFKAGADENITLTAKGGAGALTWLLASGSLPDGLRLSAAGILFGTPSADSAEHNEDGRYTNVIEVVDSFTDRVTGAPSPRRASATVEMLVRLSYFLNIRGDRPGGPAFTTICTFCHGTFFAPDFSAPSAQAIINVNSGSGGFCGTTRVYITPGAPNDSLIYQKLSDSPPCGNRMPAGGPFFTEERLERLGRWIRELTQVDTD
jgi:hypothetical protein